MICDACGLSEPDCPCCCDDECPVSIVRNLNEIRLAWANEYLSCIDCEESE